MSVNHLYQQLLHAAAQPDGSLSQVIQQRILDYGRKHRQWNLLEQLASNPRLHPDVDRQIGEVDELSVVVAWSTRPGRTTEELVQRLQSDKRVTAVLGLAKQTGLDVSVYRTLAKIKSAKLAPVLAGNPSVPTSIRLEKLAEFIKRTPRGRYSRHESVVHTICTDDDENVTRRMYETVAKNARDTPYVIACLERPYTTRADIDRWIDSLARLDQSGDQEWRSRTGDLVRLLSTKADIEQRERLLKNAEEIHDRATRSWYVSGLKNAIDEIKSIDVHSLELLAKLEKAPDRETFTDLYEQTRSHLTPAERPRLVMAVMCSPHATKEAVLAELPNVRTTAEMRNHVRTIESRGWYDVIETLIEGERTSRYVPTAVSGLVDQNAFLRQYVQSQAQTDNGLPDWVAITDVFTEEPELALSAFRWQRLTETLGNFPAVAKLLEERLIEALGDDQARWEALTSIGDSFDGTFQDLLVVARELS